MMQPGFSGPAIGIRECQNFKTPAATVQSQALKIVDFLAAPVGRPSYHHVGFHARVFGHALDDAARGVRARGEDKKIS